MAGENRVAKAKPADLTFEAISIGQAYSKTILFTEDMIDGFASFSQDKNPLHVDAEYAKKNNFKDRVAHGLISACFFSEIIGMHLPGKSSLLVKMDLNFKEPVYAQDYLSFEVKVASKNIGNLVTLDATVKGEEKVCVAGKIMVKMLK